jgi:hypothetical protein
MKVKSIPSRWIYEEGLRLDSGPYMSGALEAKKILEEISVPKHALNEVTKNGASGIYHAGRKSRVWVDSSAEGIPFLGSTKILAADLSHLPFISKQQVKSNPDFLIQEGFTLITRSGTIGRIAYARASMNGLACSEHVMRVVPDSEKIPSGYLFAYLRSKFGIPLIISGTYGSIIQSIEPHHIANLPVPRLSQKTEEKAHQLIVEAARLIDKFQSDISEATNKFFDSVGLKDIAPSDWHQQGPDLGFGQVIESSSSLRAANFNPRFQSLCSKLKSVSWKELGDICISNTLRRGGRYKRIDAEPGFGYQIIGQRQLFWLRPEGRWVAKFALDDDVFVEAGTSLIAATGTLGEHELYCRAEFIWGSMIDFAYSELFVRVVADERIMPGGCLFAFLRSETAFRMFRSISFGSKQQYLHPDFLPHLPIPFPEREKQEKIHALIIDAYRSRQKAVELENQATDLVEKAIEEAT